MEALKNKKYMFFWELPISFNCLDTSLPLTSHVYVDKNAQEVISKIQQHDQAIAGAVFTQYGISGLGCQHRLLCADLNSVNSTQARTEMWEILGLLRLVKPLPIHIAGTVDLFEEGINGFETHWHRTHLNITENGIDSLEYDLTGIQTAQMLWKFFFENRSDQPSRLRNALESFLRTTLTEPISFVETFFQKLFPILDLLCGNPPFHHGREVQSNLGAWLQHVYRQEVLAKKIDFPKVIENVWNSYRHHYLHKSFSVLPASHLYTKLKDGSFRYTGKNPGEDNMAAVVALHEIVRLCLLSLLCLPEGPRSDFDNLPCVEAHKSPGERGNADNQRRDAVRYYFGNLIEKKVCPIQTFWLSNVHEQIFKPFCKKPNAMLAGAMQN